MDEFSKRTFVRLLAFPTSDIISPLKSPDGNRSMRDAALITNENLLASYKDC